MSRDVYFKKLEQMLELVGELEELLRRPFEEYASGTVLPRAAERNFQLLVNLAVDVNLYLLAERVGRTPDSYRRSFLDLAQIGILSRELAERLGQSARLRNILVHEYDFDVDVGVFYRSARALLEPYREYLRVIHRVIRG